jgi:hypothetical protein
MSEDAWAAVRAAAIQRGIDEVIEADGSDMLLSEEVVVDSALPGPAVELPAVQPQERDGGLRIVPLHAPIHRRGTVYSFGGVPGWPEHLPESERGGHEWSDVARAPEEDGQAREAPDADVEMTGAADGGSDTAAAEGGEEPAVSAAEVGEGQSAGAAEVGEGQATSDSDSNSSESSSSSSSEGDEAETWDETAARATTEAAQRMNVSGDDLAIVPWQAHCCGECARPVGLRIPESTELQLDMDLAPDK